MARVPTWVMLCLPVAFLGPRTPQAASEACIPRVKRHLRAVSWAKKKPQAGRETFWPGPIFGFSQVFVYQRWQKGDFQQVMTT